MTTQNVPPTTPEAPPKSREQVLEEAVLELVDKVESLAKEIDTIKKTTVRKTSQRLGVEHGRKAVKDNTTGVIYPSKFAAGKIIAGAEDLKDAKGDINPLDNFAYYRITKLFPDRLTEASEEEAKAAWAKADAELQAVVDEANKAAAQADSATPVGQAPKPIQTPKAAQGQPKRK